MNILLLIGIIFALSGFKPGSIQKAQITQGMYKPSSGVRMPAGKMNTNASLGMFTGTSADRKIIDPVESNTYFRVQDTRGDDMVYYKKNGYAHSVEAYNPLSYYTQPPFGVIPA